jgi:diguanylate cyclase (GGDEF)-like protein/PAS domain S-box-containing protein
MYTPKSSEVLDSVFMPADKLGHSHRLRRRAFLWVAVLVLSSGGLVALALHMLHTQALEAGQRLTESFVQVIEEQTTRSLQTVDQSLQLASRNLAQLEASGGLDQASARAMLREQIKDLPFVRAMWVLDAQGLDLYDSDVGNTGISFADRAYFQRYLAAEPPGFHLGAPLRSRTRPGWLISASRPLPQVKGKFAGIIVAAIEPTFFDKFWRSLELTQQGSIVLMRSDGVMMTRSPFNEAAMSVNFSSHRLFSAILAGAPTGSFENISPVDGILRDYAYRTLSVQPELVVVVGQSRDTLLLHWRKLALLSASLWTLAALLTALFCLLLNRAWRQSIRDEERNQQVAQRLSLATSAASIGVWDWDLATDQWMAEPVFFTMLGLAAGPDPGRRKQWAASVHPQDQALVRSKFDAALAGDGSAFEYVARQRHADGAYRWLRVIGRVLARDELGQASRLAGVQIDVTAHKLAEDRLRQSEENLAITLQCIGDAVISTDAAGQITRMNATAERLTGWRLAEALGQPLAAVFQIIDRLTHAPERYPVDVVMVQGKTIGLAKHLDLRSLDGQTYQIADSAAPIHNAAGRVLGAVLVFSDVSDSYRAQQALADSEARYRALVEWSPEAVVVHRDGRVLFGNPAALKLFGAASLQDWQGRSILDFIHPESHAVSLARVQSLSAGNPAPMIEQRFLKVDGSVFDVEVQGISINYDGQPALQTLIRDITQRKQAEAQIRRLAFYDPLTRLPNRRLLLDRLAHAMAASARHHRHAALLFVDIDHFKTVNDTLGHHQGDVLLELIAQQLATCVREGDTLARLGGDEFVLMLENLSDIALTAAAQAEAVADKILTALRQPFSLDDTTLHNTCSIGISLFGGNVHESIEEPLKRADLAMYQAKVAGRNTLRFFDQQMQAVVIARATLEKSLREAIQQQQFLLHYQAQVTVDEHGSGTGKGSITGVEALLRWQHPQRGLVSPGEFIPLAEESGLILTLGQWVLEAACAQLHLWSQVPHLAGLSMAVNVSPRQFRQTNFVGQVLAVLERSGADPRRLKLELTESMLVDNMPDVIAKMMALKARGVGFSLDDFGTGYSSLAYLKQLPIDQLKIDQSFVKDLLTDANDAAIAKMVVALADSLGLDVMAEGVETPAQQQFLAAIGCRAYQGYLFSRPLALAEFERFIESR